jgi:hypothetical protein
MIGKRGQGAMEYLMTYSWAILVVLAVGIVMWKLGVLNLGGTITTTSTGFPRIKPQLAITSCNTSGYFRVTFTNGAGGPIIIGAYGGMITVKDMKGNDCSVSNPEAGITQDVGEDFEITGTCSQMRGSTNNPYSMDILIRYNMSLPGAVVQHTDSGSIRGSME